MLVGDQHASRSKIGYEFVKWYKECKCSAQASSEIKNKVGKVNGSKN